VPRVSVRSSEKLLTDKNSEINTLKIHVHSTDMTETRQLSFEGQYDTIIYYKIRHDMTGRLTRIKKLANSKLDLPHGTKKKQKN